MDYTIEAFVSCGEGSVDCGQRLLVGILGFIKLGDLASDIWFIISLNTYLSYPEQDGFSDYYFYVFAILFTVVGGLFDFVKAFYYGKHVGCKKTCKRGQEENGDDEEDTRKTEAFEFSWRRYNLVFEEIPQLAVLVAYFVSIDGYCLNKCQYDDTCCNDEVYNNALTTAAFSAAFTGFEIIVSVVMYYRTKCKKPEPAQPTDREGSEEKSDEGIFARAE